MSSDSAVVTSITVPKDGTYRFYWLHHGYGGASTFASNTRLYVNGASTGSNHTINMAVSGVEASVIQTEDLTLSAGDEVALRLTAGSSVGTGNYKYICAGMLAACIDWNVEM